MYVKSLPSQQLPFSKKTKEWRKKMLDWADSKTFFNFSLVRRSVLHKKINYDLINGRLHMNDIQSVLNPDNVKSGYITEKIPHYPIMNSKLNVLRGEESKRVFDYRVIITNPSAITEIENNKKDQIFQMMQQVISNTAESEEDFNAELEKLDYHFNYEWQDIREIRANTLLTHYVKEYNIPLMFNHGFMDALVCGEEIYQCDIVSGEPVIRKLNPLKVRMFKSGYSSRIEDADIVIIEDFWSPGKIIDTFYESLSNADMKYIEEMPITVNSGVDASTSNVDERSNFIYGNIVDQSYFNNSYFDPFTLFDSNYTFSGSNQYIDNAGNIRVLQMYWKSRRKIKKIKSYDPQTGEEVYNFFPETRILNKDLGEEETIYWINEAWEGVKIGGEIYINMRPRVVQYNRLSNPSICHFGIIGQVYNLNDSKPFSMVDMMKPYNYLYDAIHDRLNKAIASNWGKIMRLDLAKVPKGWDIDKWMYYAKVNHIAVEDSFNEGTIGSATGKLAGGFNTSSMNVIDAETGNYIQQHVHLLDYIKMEMAEVAGITKQREGQVSNRETVGGIERATVQSSHITEWLFLLHDDVKRRTLECFLETAKAALKGRNKKFQHILSDMSIKVVDIEGDEFAECDYGLVVDNSTKSQDLNSKLDTLAQAALQNQTLSFSTIMKLYSSSSIAEKQRFVERDEKQLQEQQSEARQQEMQANQEKIQAELAFRQQELDQKEASNIRDNETKLLIAEMSKYADQETSEDVDYSPEAKASLEEKIREFNAKLSLDKDKFEFDKKKHADEVALRNKQINKKK